MCERDGDSAEMEYPLLLRKKTCSFLFATGAPPMHGGCATVVLPLRHCCATEIDRLLYSSFFFFFLFGNVRFGPPGVPASGSRYCHVVFAEDEAVEKALEMRLTPRRMVVQENDKHGVKSTLLENPMPFK